MDQLVTYVRGYSFGGMTYSNGGLFGPIMRPYLSLLEVSKGACTLKTPEASITVTAGHIGIAATASRFEFDYQKDCSTTARWCEGFLPVFSEEEFSTLNRTYTPIPTSDVLKKLFEVGIELGHGSSPSLNAMRNSLGLAVVRGFLHSSQNNQRSRQLPEVIVRARRILEENISDDRLDMKTVAEHARVTPQYLITLFKKNVGTTPARYLWKIRLRRARELLVHTNMSQADIAFECGFKSLPHFSRSVKKQFGMTPAQLRKDADYTRPSDVEDDITDMHF
ncbi:HTH-type transcriptional activator RhaS [Roseovarius albus]|uniref:HTH-type transcriptional activator RhaS n=1 Tax=Roseovarius albus TaxID=1247867 RepID=A0A1X7A5E6_9RHOB|nr:AraC family transcriptional regulator [Roseovarius albus]SLN70661.1 HTH-type transcriptional activator RhaS [Roseovarius albus]